MATPDAPSCLNCPSYLKPEQAVDRFKKSTGSPMCGKYGTILGKPGASPTALLKLAQHFAGKCDSYGQTMTVLPASRKFEVAIPDLELRAAGAAIPETHLDKQRVTTCAACKNHVRDEIVAEELGWSTGLCKAKGRLILQPLQTIEARNCEYRAFGPPSTSTFGVSLFPEYEDAFGLNTDPIRAHFKNKENFVDPREYETDADVSTEDVASGIRAWRTIQDQDGTGNEVLLPIYDTTIFSEIELSKVPRTGDDEHPEDYIDHNNSLYKIAVLWTKLDETPAIWGMAGVGKTEIYRHLAWLMCLPFERLSITGSTELDDLAGKMLFTQEKGTYYQYGRLPKAWGKPSVICIDEPNTGPPDVWQFLRPLTDNSKQLVLDMNEGEAIPRHPDCYMGMAMNPAWDPKNVGTQQIGDADGSRLMHLHFDLPPETLEKEIIKKRVSHDGWEIDDARLKMVMAIAKELRPMCDDQIDGSLPITWGIRPQIKVARALRWFDTLTAYRMASADFLEPAAQDTMLDVVRAHIDSN
jgi:hypothetical protein